jgi:hypothetical protein
MTRKEANMAILNELYAFFEANPDQRFWQGLYNCNIIKPESAKPEGGLVFRDDYNEESSVTLEGLVLPPNRNK